MSALIIREMFYVRFENGAELSTASLEGAIRLTGLSSPEIGDEDSSGRRLVWRNADDARDDDGRRAFASITRVMTGAYEAPADTDLSRTVPV